MFDTFFATLKTFGSKEEQAVRLGVSPRSVYKLYEGEIPRWLYRLRKNPELLSALLQDADSDLNKTSEAA